MAAPGGVVSPCRLPPDAASLPCVVLQVASKKDEFEAIDGLVDVTLVGLDASGTTLICLAGYENMTSLAHG